MPNIFKAFKKSQAVPLPVFPGRKIEDVPRASILLFYGGNKLTEMVGNKLYKHPYRPPSFHAAFFIGDYLPAELGSSLFLNVGKFREILAFESEKRTTRRIDAVVFPALSEKDRNVMCAMACKDVSKPKIGLSLPDYSWTDYLRFGLKWFRPSKKDFCSENVCEIFASRGVKVSDQEPVNTAPWDLLEYAELHKDQASVFTVWRGSDFKE